MFAINPRTKKTIKIKGGGEKGLGAFCVAMGEKIIGGGAPENQEQKKGAGMAPFYCQKSLIRLVKFHFLEAPLKKVTGIGGIFFKCEDPKKMNAWYAKNLGLPVSEYGTVFTWRTTENPDKEGQTVWNPFPKDTQYFEPSKKDFMINYRVENIVELVEQLKSEGVTVLDEIKTYEYGKFVHILDPEGNSIELWEE